MVYCATVVENSFNIHQDGLRLVFREEENPQAKLMACARNDKLFSDGSDPEQLAKEIRYVIGGTEEVAKTFRVIALPKSWLSDPWSTLDESERPEHWDGTTRNTRTSKFLMTDSATRAAEESAKGNRVGLWMDNEPMPPWEWRKARRK